MLRCPRPADRLVPCCLPLCLSVCLSAESRAGVDGPVCLSAHQAGNQGKLTSSSHDVGGPLGGASPQRRSAQTLPTNGGTNYHHVDQYHADLFLRTIPLRICTTQTFWSRCANLWCPCFSPSEPRSPGWSPLHRPASRSSADGSLSDNGRRSAGVTRGQTGHRPASRSSADGSLSDNGRRSAGVTCISHVGVNWSHAWSSR